MVGSPSFHRPVTPCLILPRDADSSLSGALIRSALTETEQYQLYSTLCTATEGSTEWHLLSRSCGTHGSYLPAEPGDRPVPLCVWRHPYTGDSNMLREPSRIFQWAHELAEETRQTIVAHDQHPDAVACASLCDELCSLRDLRLDSLVSLLYRSAGALRPHVDDNLPGLGLSMSLGASCTFIYGGTEVVLHSGDALWGRFGIVAHQVKRVHAPHTAPDWWEALQWNGNGSVSSAPSHFGRVRCNLQLRRGRDEAARAARRKKDGR
mmetsp:Transcript_48323/g.108869  ORF Transcript_48323/g.108869 Transcript_48323/m.108869 type:complete len:265 (-) Transcript_48323:357-1151(-)